METGLLKWPLFKIKNIMNQLHLHLLITHLPVFGSVLGALVLGYGLWVKHIQTKMAAYYLFILSAMGAGVAYLTGEAAEEGVENIPGVAESIIGQHEDFALYALISLMVLGVISLIGLLVGQTKSSLSRSLSFVVLFFSIVSFGLVAQTGYLGGQIRHTEIGTAAVQGTGSEQGEEDND
jgi:uncharacterized membrane protein